MISDKIAKTIHSGSKGLSSISSGKDEYPQAKE
jgi:hypothetical protein